MSLRERWMQMALHVVKESLSPLKVIHTQAPSTMTRCTGSALFATRMAHKSKEGGKMARSMGRLLYISK